MEVNSLFITCHPPWGPETPTPKLSPLHRPNPNTIIKMAGGAGGALVNKAEMAKTPSAVINRYIFLVSVIISFAGGMHGANTSNISGIMAVCTLAVVDVY